MQCFLVAFGGNVASSFGNPAETMLAALKFMEDDGIRIGAKSRIFRSESYPNPKDPEYANGVIAVSDGRSPAEFLAKIHDVEAYFGRQRISRWGKRTLDLDVLSCGDLVLPDVEIWRKWHDLPLDRQTSDTPDQLILPHPRLQDRAFVLVPLMDVAPDWVHPVLGKTVRQLHDDLPEKVRNQVKPL